MRWIYRRGLLQLIAITVSAGCVMVGGCSKKAANTAQDTIVKSHVRAVDPEAVSIERPGESMEQIQLPTESLSQQPSESPKQPQSEQQPEKFADQQQSEQLLEQLLEESAGQSRSMQEEPEVLEESKAIEEPEV